MIIMKIEYTIPGKTSSLEFALVIKFIISHKRRQIGHIYLYDSFSLLLGVQSAPEVGPTSYETPCIYMYVYDMFSRITCYHFSGEISANVFVKKKEKKKKRETSSKKEFTRLLVI